MKTRSTVAAPAAPQPVRKVPLPVFSSTETKKVINYLSSQIGPRREGSIQEHSAARYIYYKLYILGYKPRIQRFMLPNGKSSQNIIVTKQGIGGRRRVILGAHYDSKRNAPGANDNASGTAALIELAKVMKGYPLNVSVDFVFFGSEEMIDSSPDHHHYGSRYYASQMSSDYKKSLAGMISVDMIGVGDKLFVRNLGVGSTVLCSDLINFATKKGVDAKYKKDPAWSDHEAFERVGVPSVWIEYKEDPNYHTSRDTADKINYGNVQRVGDILLAYLTSFK